MAFKTVEQFLAMGGYAEYVWSSYAIGLLVLGGNILFAIIKHRQLKKQLSQTI